MGYSGWCLDADTERNYGFRLSVRNTSGLHPLGQQNSEALALHEAIYDVVPKPETENPGAHAPQRPRFTRGYAPSNNRRAPQMSAARMLRECPETIYFK